MGLWGILSEVHRLPYFKSIPQHAPGGSDAYPYEVVRPREYAYQPIPNAPATPEDRARNYSIGSTVA